MWIADAAQIISAGLHFTGHLAGCHGRRALLSVAKRRVVQVGKAALGPQRVIVLGLWLLSAACCCGGVELSAHVQVCGGSGWNSTFVVGSFITETIESQRDRGF